MLQEILNTVNENIFYIEIIGSFKKDKVRPDINHI